MKILFNNKLAAGLMGAILSLFALDGAGVIQVKEIVLGALITWGGMIVIFYFRRKPDEPQPPNNSTPGGPGR